MSFSAITRILLLCLLPFSGTQASDISTRIDFIQTNFDRSASHSASWQTGWLSLFSATAAVNGLAWSQTDGEHNRYDRVVGFSTSFLGAADMLLNPMPTHHFASQLRALPATTDQQQSAKLAQAEAWLSMAAERERYEQSLLNHALANLVNGIAGLAVAYDDGRPDDGWVTFLTGVLASEIKILTAPETITDAEIRYRSGNLRPVAAAKPDTPYWQFAAFGPVLSAQYRF